MRASSSSREEENFDLYSAKAPHGRAGGSGGRASCGEAPTNASSIHLNYPNTVL